MSKNREKVTGTVTEILGAGLFAVDVGEKTIRARVKKRLTRHRVIILIGDEVVVEIVEQSDTHYITYRKNNKK